MLGSLRDFHNVQLPIKTTISQTRTDSPPSPLWGPKMAYLLCPAPPLTDFQVNSLLLFPFILFLHPLSTLSLRLQISFSCPPPSLIFDSSSDFTIFFLKPLVSFQTNLSSPLPLLFPVHPTKPQVLYHPLSPPSIYQPGTAPNTFRNPP